jgi:sugar phosphate permease
VKAAGLLLLPAAWVIVISAAVLFPRSSLQWAFVLAGLLILGAALWLTFRGSRRPKERA